LPKPMSYHKAVAIDNCIYVYKDGEIFKHCPDLNCVEVCSSSDEISISPNPCNDGIFTIESSKKIEKIQIFSIDGREISDFELNTSDNKHFRVNLIPAAKEGVFIIKLVSEQGTFISKLLLTN